MKTLIVEDDFTSRTLLQEILSEYGPAHIAVNGREAVAAAREAYEKKAPYDLVCMDILMPEMNGQQALKEIRAFEESLGIFSSEGLVIVMVTSVNAMKSKAEAYHDLCDAYITKPFTKAGLMDALRQTRLAAGFKSG